MAERGASNEARGMSSEGGSGTCRICVAWERLRFKMRLRIGRNLVLLGGAERAMSSELE